MCIRDREYDFVLDPGADPSAIRLEFRGADGVHLTPAGDIAIETAAGTMIQERPVIYQEDPVTAVRRPVAGRYVLLAGNVVAVRLERYDRKRKLVIDPVIVYSTYMGGSSADQINVVQLTPKGLLYIAGQTNSTDLPFINGAYNNFQSGIVNVFLAIVDTTATGNFALVYASYIGSPGIDTPSGLAVDANGVMYVGGTTTSPLFPTTANGFNITGDASFTAGFVFQLDPSQYGGNSLLYSTFLCGSSGNDTISGLTLDAQGNIYVIGSAGSYDFPVTTNAFATVQYGTQDAFVAELNPNSATLLYSTYIGGQDDDFGVGIALAGPPGQVYVAFNTQSPDFPMAGYSYQASKPGPVSMVLGLMDLTQTGVSSLVYATFFGGSNVDEVRAIAIDAKGNLMATGYTCLLYTSRCV